jgi:3-oxoacyl-[acyl-carrier-protein] synthase II
LGEISSLAAIAEAVRVIERGHADTMIAGGSGSNVHPAAWIRGAVFGLSRRSDDPAAASRPFDAMRDGAVNGEGAGALILETRENAEARGAKLLARILGFAGTFEPRRNGQVVQGTAIRHAITGALRNAGVDAADIGHVNANASGALLGDAVESQAIAATLGDVPVTAPKSYFGDLGAGSGAVELAVSLLALEEGAVAPTLNYEYPDPECPVNVVRGEALKCEKRTALVLNDAHFGQAMAMVLGEP